MEGDTLCAYGSSGSCCQSILTGSCAALPLNSSNYHVIPPTGLVIAIRSGMDGHRQAIIAVIVVVAMRGVR
jgi:hypothetical protein